MSERLAACIVLIFSIYGGVYAVLNGPDSLIAIFVFLIVCAIWTVLSIWDQPEFGESFDGE